MAAKEPHRKQRRGIKSPKHPDPANPKRYKGLPPGFRMRLCRYARALTLAEVDKHNALGKCRVLKIGTNGKPVIKDNTNPNWPIFELVEVDKLQVSGLILLYDANRYIVRVEDPVNNEGPGNAPKKQTLLEVLRELARKKQNGDPTLAGVEYYKVSRYRVEPKFAVSYFDRFWDRKSVEEHLTYFKTQFYDRELVNKKRGKPVHIWP